MRNLKDLEINIVSGGACTGTAPWYACMSDTASHAGGSCSGGKSGSLTVPGPTTKYYYCAKTLATDTEAGLRAALTVSGYCNTGDIIYGFSLTATMAGTGDNAGTCSISGADCL